MRKVLMTGALIGLAAAAAILLSGVLGQSLQHLGVLAVVLGAVIALAAIELRGNRPDSAVRLLEVLLDESDRFPERSQALFVLGETYLTKLRDRAKAKEILRRLSENYADRYAQAAQTLLRYIALQEQGMIGDD